MPPPTQSDPWLQSRRFGIVIDAGSSGSRLQIYSWKDVRVERTERKDAELAVLPRVEKGTKNSDDWVAKIEPGISSFALEPTMVGPYLSSLLEHAQNQIPPSLHQSTPIYLLATAGMRLLAVEQQEQIIEAACTFLKFHSNFKVKPASPQGPCGGSIRVITGEDEGLYGWIAVNYLLDGFSRHEGRRATYGFLDMGGASTQIAFEPGAEYRKNPQLPLKDVRLRLLDGEELHHQVFVTTWLGYGTNQARERYVGSIVSHWDQLYGIDQDSPSDIVPDPCLPRDLTSYEAPVILGPASDHSKTPHTLKGTGSFPQCLRLVEPLLNKNAPCPDTNCLFNGVSVPPIDFSVSRFIGVSEYWYSSEHVFGLGGAYDFVQYERAAIDFCSKDWDSIVAHHLASKSALAPTATDIRVHSRRDVDLARLELQCFKAAWIVNVLHEGIGLPRIVDPGGNSTTGGQTSGDKFSNKADEKGLGAPAFQSLDSVGDTAITWTLGMMVLEAVSEIPTTYIGTPGIGNLDPDFDDDGLPFLGDIEDTLKEHLHPSLTKPIFGFSPISLILFSLLSLIIAYVFRSRLKAVYRKIFRPRNGYDYAQAYAMEGGGFSGINDLDSPPLTPYPNGSANSKGLPAFVRHALRRLRRNVLGPTSPRLPAEPTLRPVRLAPPAQISTASSLQRGGLTTFSNGSAASIVQRAASPAVLAESASPPSPTRSSALNPGLPVLSLSRNVSQVNLTTIVPRSSSFIRGGAPR
ncbi:hypothetical protein DACRYDRAFT_23162 [Dacryopinax primogenitus]|uniref:Nucleoside phosphatase GDA1/CD39 n=1 Tax=Dacryopinax primogenitus (strain DJM 731) TaxID=1858805 RepID=M5G2U1_DACPD|nr:uncharacterized protein DACRYDRAFT_23162 [Dacryopinax primogenitus]EJU00157.1 hypothetical protein DACRYDRAFT_23162 [Dacryopinax primogenitus]